jgi:hypothetical protein
MPLLLLGPSVRLARARDEMLVLTPSNRVTEPDDPFRRIVAPARIDALDGFGASEEIDGLAEAEQDGRDAAHLLSEPDPRVAALTSDLLGGLDGVFTPLEFGPPPDERARPLLLTSPVAGGRVPAETVGRLRRAVAAARRLPALATSDAPLLLTREMRVGPARPDAEMRRMLTEIVREELAGAWGRRIAADIRRDVMAEMRGATGAC